MASFGGQQSNDSSSTGGSSNSGLRQPKNETVSRLLNPQGSGGGTMSSKLSADAPEFVPRSFSGYKPPTLSASAPEFVPRVAPQSDYYQQSQDDYDPVIEEFKHTLQILNMHPGNVEEYMKPLCKKFQHGVRSAEQMAEIIDVLFQQSVTEANFRYTGARICQHICNSFKDHSVLQSFRNAFLRRCQKEYERREDLVTNPDTSDLITGFTLFMGELFLNLEIIADGKKTKMKLLPEILKDLILTLLSQPSKPTVKCTCQLLKLVGYNMDKMMSPADNSPSPFDEIFSQLQLVMQSNTLDDTSKFMIKSVLNLRVSNWGHTESTSSSIGEQSFNGSLPSEFIQNEPVFYDTNGQQITREQAGFYTEEIEDGEYILDDEEDQAFLEWQAEQNSEGFHNDGYNSNSWSHTDDQGYYGMINNDDEMDDETEAAYEEFLKQARHQAYH